MEKRATEEKPESAGGLSTRAAVVVGAAVALLLVTATALGVWGLPVLRTHRALAEQANSVAGTVDVVGRLGGKKFARHHLRTYLWLPDWLAPHKAEAVDVLAKCGAEREIIEALEHPAAEVRIQAVRHLGWLHSPRPVGLPPRTEWEEEERPLPLDALLHALRDPDIEVRASAARALEYIGPRAKPAAEGIKAALQDEDPYVRAAAAHAFWNVTGDAQTGVSVLIRDLASPDENTHSSAWHFLPYFGEKAVPALVSKLGTPNVKFRRRVAGALDGVNEDSMGRPRFDVWADRKGPRPMTRRAIPALIEALADDDPEVRESIARALAFVAPLSEEVVAALKKACEDENAKVRQAAKWALEDLALFSRYYPGQRGDKER